MHFSSLKGSEPPKPLKNERDAETRMYRDRHLQNVWKNAVIGEFIQAIGRARLVRKARTVIILTSHFITGITDRTETQLFDEAVGISPAGLTDKFTVSGD